MTRICIPAATLSLAFLATPALLARDTNHRASAPPAADADTYIVDPVHSSVIFKVSHMNVSNFYGRFNDAGGTISIDTKNPAASSVDVQIVSESVDTHSEARDKHLRSADFFSVKEFPKISFKSKSVKKVDDHNYEIAGELTLRGVSKPLTVKAAQTGTGKNPQSGAASIGFETTFTVKRSDFGVKYGAGALGEEVQLTVALEANQKAERAK
jgi:polyisoprenoid-binding protein YceI